MFARKLAVVPNTRPLVLAGVSRVSLEIQVTNYSLEAQDFDFGTLEEKFNCTIPEEFRIADEGFQGADFKRPSIKKVIRWIREGKVEGVAYPHVDRFARDLEGGLALIRMICEAGGQVLIGNIGWYVDESDFRMRLQMYLMIAERTKVDIKTKSRGGVLAKLRRGLVHYGRAGVYGYRFVSGLELALEATKAGRVPDKKPQNELRRVEENIARYILMGDLALQGESAKGICRQMIARGIPSPRGKKWNSTFVSKTLHDPCYYEGVCYFYKTQAVPPLPTAKLRKNGDRHLLNTSKRKRDQSEWIPYHLPGGPVVTKERWAAVIEALERNRIITNGRPADYELSGLVTCAACKAAVCGHKRQKRPGGTVYRTYQCSRRDRVNNQHTCPAHGTIRAQVLEEGVWDAVRHAITQDLERLVELHRETILEEVDTEELERCQKELDRVTKKMVDASRLHDREDDETLKREYANQVTDWKAQKRLLERRLSSFSTEVQEVNVDCKTIARRCARAFELAQNNPAKRREYLLAFVEGIKYANGHADVTLRIPKSDGGNSNSREIPTGGRKGQHTEHYVDPFDHHTAGFVYINIGVDLK